MSLPRLWKRGDPLCPADARYIGRGSPWGNPLKVGVHGSRLQVVRLYEAEVLPLLDLEPLRGHDLVCHCVPQLCHGHPILFALYGREATLGVWPRFTDDRQGSLL